MTKRRLLIWRAILLLYLLAVAYVCFTPADKVPQMPAWDLPVPIDKLVHFSLFLPFPVVTYFAFNARKTYRNLAVIFLTGLLLAGLTEILQSFSPGRSMDALDFLADGTGITLSCLLLLLLLKQEDGCDGK